MAGVWSRKATHPTWNRTLGPMQKKQSTIRNANIIGMLLINLYIQPSLIKARRVERMTHRLRNHGRDATDSCTSTSWKWSCIMGKHRCTSASNTRWSSNVPCIDGLRKPVEHINIQSREMSKEYCSRIVTG